MFSLGNAFNPNETDKQVHMFGSYAVTDALERVGFNWWQSGLTLLAIGIVKESTDDVYDSEDIKANITGWLGYRLVHIKF